MRPPSNWRACYGHQRGIEKPAIVVLEGAFHGRTLATLSATGNRKIQAGFEPLVAGFIRAPRNDVDALRQIAANNPDVVAFLAEPIQGEGGVNPLDQEYLQAARQICDEQDWLLMLDEVQTGNGRTGTYFAYQGMGSARRGHHGQGPGQRRAHRRLPGPRRGGTGAGRGPPRLHLWRQPAGLRRGLAVVNTIQRGQLCANATAMGQLITRHPAGRQALRADREIRGRGLMLGIELQRDCGELVQRGLDAGLLINVTAGNTMRLLPPLIINEQEARELAAASPH